MNNFIRFACAIFVAMLVTGCGGGSNAFTSSGSSGSGSGSGGGSGGGTSSAVKLGSGIGSGFSSGVLSVAASSLSAGGSTTVTATLVDSAGNPYTTPVDVSFVSSCLATGNATLTSPVTSVAGIAVSTYRAVGCTGTDVITATATVGSDTLSATGSVTVASSTVGSIEYVSASPNVIAIKGTGGAETSNVIFRVLDQSGGPVAGQAVTFAIDTPTSAGVQFTPASGTTDANGLVQTVVQSGTTKTGVRVTATVTSSGISTQSDGLVVSTALADQDSFSLSASVLSPEGYDYDGVVSVITAHLADRYNNPVPDGTAVSFYADGGSIVGSCTTTAGACSANWTSQNPRPASGRVHILAVAKGEESFVDVNGNGVFDSGDTFTDIPEAFEDDNETGNYAVGERFVDQNGNLTHDGADGKFNGVLCQHPTLCGTSSINVYNNLVLVMSGSGLNVNFVNSGLSVPAGTKSSDSTTVTVFDDRNQRPPAGTTIQVSTSNGTLLSPTSFTIADGNGNGPYAFGLTIAGDGTSSAGGLVTVKVTTPKGVTSYGFASFSD